MTGPRIPTCDYCGSHLTEPGAIVIGPPNPTMVSKVHLCTYCLRCEPDLAPIFAMLEDAR